jgi:hypothetical protein
MGIHRLSYVCIGKFNHPRNQIVMEERQDYYKVRYAGKLIKVLPAHSKWEAMDKLYSYYINRYPWIKREKLTAVKYGKKFKN